MSCNVNGTGCRVCPGMWLAGILLVMAIIQGLFSSNATPESPTEAQPSTENLPVSSD